MRGSGKPDVDWLAKGVWIAEHTGVKGIVGFHINSLYSRGLHCQSWLKNLRKQPETAIKMD